MRRGRLGFGLVVLLVVSGAACVVQEDPKEVARCEDADPAVLEQLEGSISDPELRLRRVFQVPSKDQDGVVFVSGEIVSQDDGEGDDGDIATWSITGGDLATLTSVSEHAAEDSTIEAADDLPTFIDVDGYITSRGCVDHARPPRALETG